jgi:hypothetical protein
MRMRTALASSMQRAEVLRGARRKAAASERSIFLAIVLAERSSAAAERPAVAA